MGPKRGKAPKKTGPAAHQLAPRMPNGTSLTDTCKKHWILADTLGQGGFGLIYQAHPEGNSKDKNYAVKIEPKGNGPLFCEIHFYVKVANKVAIEKWLSGHTHVKHLGIPVHVANGILHHNSAEYRFLVMQKFSHDLQRHVDEVKSFPRATVAQLAIQVITALEFIHDSGYVHADIKAANLLFGAAASNKNLVYLVDFGLVNKYKNSTGEHKEYKEDPTKAHDGTIEFTSRDAHKGVAPSRRGDMEILGYCLLQWTCGTLPWLSRLSDKPWVGQQKSMYLRDPKSLFRTCNAPDELQRYFQYVADMGYDEEPDYSKCLGFFRSALKSMRVNETAPLIFKETPSIGSAKVARTPKAKRTPAKSPSPSPIKDTPSGRRGRAPKSPAGRPKTPVKNGQSTSPVSRPTAAMQEILDKRAENKKTGGALKTARGRKTPGSGTPSSRAKTSAAVSRAKVDSPIVASHQTPIQRVKTNASDKSTPSSQILKRQVKRKRLKSEERKDTSTQTTPGLKKRRT